MFYETRENNHGLESSPFNSLIIPRPIGWISSQDTQGNINLAPYSYFNAVSDNPPMVMFATVNSRSDGSVKDTIHNVETQGEFVVNMATFELREAVNLSSKLLPRHINEFLFTELEAIPSKLIQPPRVKCSPIHLECVYYQSVQLPISSEGYTNRVVIGQVVGIHIDDSLIISGKVDITRIKPIARLGYSEYAVIDNIFNMYRP